MALRRSSSRSPTPASPGLAVETSAQRGVAVARQLREITDAKIAVAIARQLTSFGMLPPAVVALASADPADPDIGSLIEGAAVVIARDGVPRINLRWDGSPPKPPAPPPASVAPAKAVRPSQPDPYNPGALDGMGTAETNATLRLRADRQRRGEAGWWEYRLELTIGSDRQRVVVPTGQSIPGVLDDLAQHGWRLVAVVVEASTIVYDSQDVETSQPVCTAYHLGRDRPAKRDGAP